jgi:hypothetical protein
MTSASEMKGVRWAFYAIEAFILLACLYGLALRITESYACGEHLRVIAVCRFLMPLLNPMLLAFVIACGALLFGAPFFFRRLRWVALGAWAMGAAALLWAGCLDFFL